MIRAIQPTNIQLTLAYQEWYFTPRYKPTYRLNDFQHYLAKRLFQQMQKVLVAFPTCTFYKDLGIVLPEELRIHTREGRVLPELCDLYFAEPYEVKLPRYREFFGKYFTQSVGGLQFVVRGKEPWEVYKRIVWEAYKRNWWFGRVHFISGTWYKEPVIYLTNDKLFVYNNHIRNRLMVIEGRRFLFSKNNGITYRQYLPARAS